MTVTQLLRPVLRELGEFSENRDTREQFVQWANESIEEVLASGPWPLLDVTRGLTLLEGVSEYVLASDVADVIAITEPTTGEALVYRPLDDVISRGYKLDTPGRSTIFWYTGHDADAGGTSIRVWPVPTEGRVFSVLGRPRMASTLAETDTVPLPGEFISVVRDLVRGRYAESLVLADKATELTERYADRARARASKGLAGLLDRYGRVAARHTRMQPRDVAVYDAFGVPQLPTVIG